MLKVSAAEGVMIRLTPQGGISLKGESEAVSRWSAVLKSRKSDLVAYLTNEKTVCDWLDRIGEDDPAVIDEVLDQCRQESEALVYFMMRAKASPIVCTTTNEIAHCDTS
jgi:hypothetical protein